MLSIAIKLKRRGENEKKKAKVWPKTSIKISIRSTVLEFFECSKVQWIMMTNANALYQRMNPMLSPSWATATSVMQAQSGAQDVPTGVGTAEGAGQCGTVVRSSARGFEQGRPLPARTATTAKRRINFLILYISSATFAADVFNKRRRTLNMPL